jgi:hypothetical protein
VSTDAAHSAPTLADLDPPARDAAFDRLQDRMQSVWAGIRSNDPLESVVIVPSLTLDRITVASPAMFQAMEERFLFMLLLLRQPRLRMVYVTSGVINPSIVEYYLSLLPGVIPSHAMARLHLVAVGDGRPGSLTEKVLERPRLIAHLRSLIPDPHHSHLVPYTTTNLERDLAIQLGIPMYGADPRLFHLGTKSGCRKVFTEAGVALPAGAEDLATVDDLVAALADLRHERPGIGSAMVKLNEGVSGSGNAVVDLQDLPAPGAPQEAAALAERVHSLSPENPAIPVEAFLAKLGERRGVVEERIEGEDLRSPSVQLRVLPDGELEVLSTHDQLLGGPTGQVYLGARFPADPAYAREITEQAVRIGEVLATKGVLGRFAIDFIVTRHGQGWRCFAIEVNLRKGGTTHPFLTLQFLTDGLYEPGSCRFVTPAGAERHLVATDHLSDPVLRGLRVDDLFDLVARTGLHYDQSRQRGVVFHMISAITECGTVGMTAIAESAAGAEELYAAAEEALLAEARASVSAIPLPP